MNAIPDPVYARAEVRPDDAALVTADAVWSWADLDARVAACAARLQARVPGRRADAPQPLGGVAAVGIVARTGPDLVVVLLAALRAGVVAVPMSPRWPAAAVEDAAHRLGLRMLVVGDEAPAPEGFDVGRLADLAAPGDEGVETGPIPLGRPWTVVHTSGSTGVPKAALHTVGNHVWSARGVSERLDLRTGDRWLLDLPLAHVGGLGVVVRCVLAGASIAIPEPGAALAETLDRFRPTHASLVATQLIRLFRDAPDRTWPSLRAVLLGGGAVPPGLIDAAADRGIPLSTGYGMTETASTVTATVPGTSRAELATSGALLPHRDLRVRPEGEIWVRGETLFAGYATAEALVRPLTPDGWFATGDLGTLDAAGRLIVGGRRDNRFKSGGEAVQPEAVEAALGRLPGVADAIVVPVSDAEFGARPVAFVRPSGGTLPHVDALRAGLRETLPGFAVPVAFHEWAGPEGMKPDRRALAAEAQRRCAQE